MALSVSGAQNLLDRCVKAFSRAGMYFKADKSRSIVFARDKSNNMTPFYLLLEISQTTSLPYIQCE